MIDSMYFLPISMAVMSVIDPPTDTPPILKDCKDLFSLDKASMISMIF